MRYLGLLATSLSIFLSFTSPALAWYATGHRLIAAIAYDRLTPKSRARVDALIRRHPDYERLFLRNAPAEPEARARIAFIAASLWPDQIKSDPRFYDETRSNASPTQLLPCFPDMARHTTWHYYDIPYAPDGADTEPPKIPNALVEVKRIIAEVGNREDVPPTSASNPVYLLPWLEHIEGDLHEPLHCVSRFLKSQPQGDAGGNGVFIGGKTLHAVWDGAAGTDSVDDEFIASRAAELVAAHPAPRHIDKKPEEWVEESFKLCLSDVYTFGNQTGTRANPLPMPPGYEAHASQIAQQRIAMAGYRLAAVLNDKLK